MKKDIHKDEIIRRVAAEFPAYAVHVKVLECLAPFAQFNYVYPSEVISLLRGIKSYRQRYIRTGHDVETQRAIVAACEQLIEWLETKDYPDSIYDWTTLFNGEQHDVLLWTADPRCRPLHPPTFVCDRGSVRGLVAAAARRLIPGVKVSVKEWRGDSGRTYYTVQAHR